MILRGMNLIFTMGKQGNTSARKKKCKNFCALYIVSMDEVIMIHRMNSIDLYRMEEHGMNIIANGVWKIRLGEPEKLTPMTFKEEGTLLEVLDQLPCQDESPLKIEDIRFKTTARGCVIELPLQATEKIYGFGLQLKGVNHTGKKKQLRVNSDPVYDTGDSHAPVPFYVSTGGYGILVDTARYVTFYCGGSRKVVQREFDRYGRKKEIADDTFDLYRVQKLKEDANVVIEIPHAQGADIYVFSGPDMQTAVQRYNLFSGGGCMPPYWGLGIWYRIYGKSDRALAMKIAEGMREARIPCDVFGLEPGWQTRSYSCSYRWDDERFPNHPEILERLSGMGYKINLWEHAFVHPSASIYNDLKAYSGDYEVWGGLVPDFSLEKARGIFAKYHGEELVDKGITSFKLDECDSSDYNPANWSFPNCSEFPSGLDGEQMHSLFGILYQKTVQSVFEERNQRTYCSVRSSYAFAAPMPFVLYSDLYDHRDFVRGVVNMGFSGLLWSPEVRQCASVEDLVRRLQSVVFSPQALVNAWTFPNPPWLQFDREKNRAGELLENYEEVRDLCRKIFEVRMQLIPYLYSSFARYAFEGIPPFRALVMDYPEDENTYDIDDEYMMGEALLVAPVFAGQSGRSVYLPEGNWYCFWTGKKYEGKQTVSMETELDTIPVFVKEGTLLPLAKPVEYITPETCFEVAVRCYGENCRSAALFEDDGQTYDFKKGRYNLVHLEWSQDGKHKATRKGNYPGEKYRVTGWESYK